MNGAWLICSGLQSCETAFEAGATALVFDFGRESLGREAAALVAAGRAASGDTRVFMRTASLEAGDLATFGAFAPHLDGVVMAAGCGADIQHAGAALAVVEAESGLEDGALGIVAAIESPLTLLRLNSLVGASRRLRGLIFDRDALAGRLGAADGAPEPLRTARSLTLVAAAAAGVAAIESASTATDPQDLRRDAALARRDGFRGKIASSAADVPVIKAAFAERRQGEA